jgi:hypothetical protein
MSTLVDAPDLRLPRTVRSDLGQRLRVSSWSTGRPWTEDDVELLCEMISEFPIVEIAARLNRSEASIRTKVKAIRRCEDNLGGFKSKDLADLLGVSIRQIRRWREKGYLSGVNGRITEASFSKFCRTHWDKIEFDGLSPEVKVWLRDLGYPRLPIQGCLWGGGKNEH